MVAAHRRCGHASDPASAPHAGGLFCVRYRSGSPATSHVIPLQVFQTLNSERWNCNVFGRSRKMTEGNYVRLLFGVSRFIEALPGLPVPFAPVLPGVLLCLWCLLSGVRLCLWCRWCSGRRWPLLLRYRSGSPATSHVIPLHVFQTLNSERWNCNVFGWSRKMTEGNYVRLLSGL